MAVYYLEIDPGNGWVKVSNGNSAKKFPHALRALTTSEWARKKQFAGSQGMHPDFIEIYEGKRSKSGVGYSTGEAAQSDGFREFRNGAARYVPGYLDVLVLRAMTMYLKDSSFQLIDNDNEIVLTVTHAPQDAHFANDIVNCLKGFHKVEHAGKMWHFNVVHVETTEEPVMGLLCYTLDNDGKPYPKEELWLAPGRVLVLDIGAYTANYQEADQNGVPSNEGHSVTAGVNKVKDEFVRLMRESYPKVFTNGDSITSEMVDYAFMNRKNGHHTLWGGGTPYVCDDQIELAIAPLMGEVQSVYMSRYRAGQPYGTLLLDGGGCALMNEILRDKLGHPNMKFAHKLDKIQFANVTGASKMRKMMVRKGYM